MAKNWSNDFGKLIHDLRKKNKLPLRKVAAKLDIDTSTLSKIEKCERKANSKIIPIIARLFNLDYKELQITYLSQRLNEEFGQEPFFDDAVKKISKK